MEDQLRDLAVKLFEDGSVDAIIGYEAGTLPLRAAPCVIKNAQQAEYELRRQSGNLLVTPCES